MTDRQFERAVLDWLEDGSDRTPRPSIDAVLLAIRTTPQERGLRIPWRFPAMNPVSRVVVVAAALAVAIGAFIALRPASNIGPASTPSPVPSAAPTQGTTVVDQSPFGYTITIPASWHPGPVAGASDALYLSAAAPVTAVVIWVGTESGDPPTFTIHELLNEPVDITGTTSAQLLEGVDDWWRRATSVNGRNEHPTTVDGESGLVTEHLTTTPDQITIQLVVTHGTRAYDLQLSAPGSRATEARAAFDALVTSIRWTP